VPIIKVQVQLFGTIDINVDEREENYPIDELLTFMDVDEDEADSQDWAEGMVKFDLDNDPSIIMDETVWDYESVKVSTLEA
jgi:hypothetical protein